MIDFKDIGKPVNTCLSAGTDIVNTSIASAKEFLTKNYHNRYNIPPHITYMICPFSEHNLKQAIMELDDYFKDKATFKFELSELHFDHNKNFFSIPIVGPEIGRIHEDFVHLFNKHRDGCVREKDLLRIKAGERSVEEIELIKRYGYFRILDKFTPHITIGNVESPNENMQEINRKLIEFLNPVIGKTIEIDRVRVIFHTDSESQTEMRELWSKDYFLN